MNKRDAIKKAQDDLIVMKYEGMGYEESAQSLEVLINIALSKPKPLEFPSWEKFRTKVLSTGIRGYEIYRGSALIRFSHFRHTERNQNNDYVTHDMLCAEIHIISMPNKYGEKHSILLKCEDFFYTEAGYNAAKAQLQTWLEQIYDEIGG
jgi:hypothetical protein